MIIAENKLSKLVYPISRKHARVNLEYLELIQLPRSMSVFDKDIDIVMYDIQMWFQKFLIPVWRAILFCNFV